MQINRIGYQPNFTANFQTSADLYNLTIEEVTEGRFKDYKVALNNLKEVHPEIVLDISKIPNRKGFLITNEKRTVNTTGTNMNLTDVVNILARPASRMHIKLFGCNGISEANEIRKEFYV